MTNVESTLADLREQDVVHRIWTRDHTVWKPDPEEIADRLGWLDVVGQMRRRVSDLTRFADEVRDDGFKDVVLLGMGGSSLGPEVLRQTLDSAPGYPRLTVLDSTVPETVTALADSVDLSKTLFIVSSKSGGTIEPNVLYKFFRQGVNERLGEEAGRSFVAITDPDTQLEELGRRDGFRRVFPNPSDIGGRYSVLSYFGLVPAVLAGMNIGALLDRAAGMLTACGPSGGINGNWGALLGATMSVHAMNGRDKLTLVTSSSIGSFGLWVEQLIAESTGKEGKGIVPVAGESVFEPEAYGDDRLFVYLRVRDDDNAELDASIDALEAAGHPVERIDLADVYDLGAEFFRWEFATAIAGSVLGINPFDQPNVQSAKDQTDHVLQEGGDDDFAGQGTLDELLDATEPGNYLAVMAFIQQTPETDAELARLRDAITRKAHIATTLGYGPRFLHSTGQLHKGGPATSLFLQFFAGRSDLEIPGEGFKFGTLADAQAEGDFRALTETGRPVVSLKLGANVAAEIGKLTESVG